MRSKPLCSWDVVFHPNSTLRGDGQFEKKLGETLRKPDREKTLEDPAAGKRYNESGERTRNRILDAAERLFAEHGFDGVSMRAIAAAADIPLALSNYHFRSKEGLYRAVFERRIEPMSADRRALMSAIMSRSNPPPRIEELVEALTAPWIRLNRDPGGRAYVQLIAREVNDPAEGRRGILRSLLDPIGMEMITALEKTSPGVSKRRIHWVYHFLIGAMILIIANPQRIKRISGPNIDIENTEALIRELVTFFSEGFRAMSALDEPTAPSRPRKTSRGAGK